MLEWLRLTREIYNAALQERRDAWAKQRVSVTRADQEKQLPAVREARPEFDDVPIRVQRGALRRIDKAFAAFFRRCKAGEKPGYPRFKSSDHFSSILIDDLDGRSPIVAGGRRVKVPMLGKIKCYQIDRPLQGTPKAMRITTDGDGHWFVTFACVDVPAKPLPATGEAVGVDLGLLTFAATSDGEKFRNPRVLDAQRIATERAQRRVSRRVLGSRRRRGAVRLLRSHHARTANLRRENHIHVARSLVGRYDTIFVEALSILGLARGALARSVNDAAWGNFLHWLRCKAENAGREVVGVDPRGTSLTCSRCGCVGPKLPLSQRVFRCADCGFTADRDVNAGCNIKGLGLALRRGAALVEARH